VVNRNGRDDNGNGRGVTYRHKLPPYTRSSSRNEAGTSGKGLGKGVCGHEAHGDSRDASKNDLVSVLKRGANCTGEERSPGYFMLYN